MKLNFISMTSDFGTGSEEAAIMKAAAMQINLDATILDLRHDVPDFNLMEGAWTLESVSQLPIGSHVCVVDPGVGTDRKCIIIQTARGDMLVGPDNGVLIPAAKRLGGIVKAVDITNEKYMRLPVSPVFHGRDIFAPAAAWLSMGIGIDEFGPEIPPEKLVKPPYEEAEITNLQIKAKVIHVNKFGSVSVNILFDDFSKTGIKYGDEIVIELISGKIVAKFMRTFGEVAKKEIVALPDDFGRIEIAVSQGNFSRRFKVKLEDQINIWKRI